MGHSRLRHGLHSTGSRTTRARGPVGPVVVSSVAPKIATVGTPRAEATCIPPESLVRYTRQAAARSIYSAKLVSPAKLWTGTEMALAMVEHRARSSFDPKIATDAPSSPATIAADAANRSASQRLADPY